MTDTTRTILIALGVALLVVVVVPLLFMAGMMEGMMGDGAGMMDGWSGWVMGGLVVLVLLGGIALVAIGMRR